LEVAIAGRKNHTRGVWEYKITPIEYFLRNKGKLSKRYMRAVNNLDKFKINTSFKLKKGTKFIPLHIRNNVRGKTHLNLLIINGNNVYRIEPSSEKYTKIKEKNVKKALSKFFKKYSMKYRGFYKNSKSIKHGRLCRFVSPLEYLYKNIRYSQIKREIIKYLNYLIN
jgi:hypothetical protein